MLHGHGLRPADVDLLRDHDALPGRGVDAEPDRRATLVAREDRHLRRVAKRQDSTPAKVALAWVLRQDGVVAIPKASRLEHVRENRGALELRLTTTDLAELDRAFPPPTKATPLEML